MKHFISPNVCALMLFQLSLIAILTGCGRGSETQETGKEASGKPSSPDSGEEFGPSGKTMKWSVFPEPVAKAWMKAGATLHALRKDELGKWVQAEFVRGSGKPEEIPELILNFKSGVIAQLPAPQTSFGLVLNGPVTDKGLGTFSNQTFLGGEIWTNRG